MDEKTILEIIMASAVISAIISGLISFLIARMECKNSLKLKRSDRKLELSVEIFNKLQCALDEIESSNQVENSTDTFDERVQEALIRKYQATDHKMAVAKKTIDQLAYLIPKERAQNFKDQYKSLEQFDVSLFQCAWKTKGVNIPLESMNDITPENFTENMVKYINDVQAFLDSLKEEITDVLRSLCEV